ncbi:uncharacterized protein LOC130691287 [Daphnia carinata]|uniref:uncharacterized protein LOC130691287 n=1 Tax=Daphnia carinata TaxID=120202 RepID=UPI0025803E9E|nr:uncharacterized protein LOC130691287 [Daphnia carinata]
MQCNKRLLFLFSVSILGFGDQQSHALDPNVRRSWIRELATRVKAKKGIYESETTPFSGKNEHQYHNEHPTAEAALVTMETTQEFSKSFGFGAIRTQHRQNTYPYQTQTTYPYPTTTLPRLPTVPSVAIALGAIAIAIAVGVATTHSTEKQIDEIDLVIRQFDNQTPINECPMPVFGNDFPRDGCEDNAVRVANGKCFPVLTRGPCENNRHWITIDPITLKGRCTPRLCGRERVLVVRDGLCHDVNDPNECQGGRRLYYTAYGDPICDCPIGQYPFPNPHDNCVPLFTQGPCQNGYVVTIGEQGRLGCTPTKCESIDNDNLSRQLVPANDGVCYALGSRGPCATTSQLLGYDIFKRRDHCVDILNPSSPYFSWPAQDDFLDSIYNQLHPEYDEFRVSFVYESLTGKNETQQRRQGASTIGAIQFPSTSIGSLLHPCRTGARRGINFKCTNPLVPTLRTMQLLQVVRPGLRTNCEGNALFVAATGQCRARF